MPSYKQSLEALSGKMLELDYVKKFQKVEQELLEDAALFEQQEEMKKLQKDAILYKKIEKMQAFKESSHHAMKIEKSLKNNPLVMDYYSKMQDVNDLVQYVTGEIEQRVNAKLTAEGTDNR